MFQAHRPSYHSTICLRVIKKGKQEEGTLRVQNDFGSGSRVYRDTSLIRNSLLLGPYRRTVWHLGCRTLEHQVWPMATKKRRLSLSDGECFFSNDSHAYFNPPESAQWRGFTTPRITIRP